ncbi:hypothetical protein PBAT_00670 [Paenibacillus antarcticus]|uniref:Uncharacterized protein n=2 Tax=Paenibacillus antarcticus TaxID=253703 RepID=A0A168QTK5_9BACL|nr:hypothetical protein [Paenibacillus antarcticus]OAB48188.1 hypothetical protein PBAT_00670 [Paenibacillus antarcticus]
MRMPSFLLKSCMTSLLILTICICFFQSTKAHANYFTDFYNGLEQFSELPSEIKELKNSYEQSRSELNEAKERVQTYAEQNIQLMEQNRQLTETVQLLKQAETSRQNRANQIKSVVIWAIALAVGYFILTRTIRFVMRRSNKW